MQNAQLIKVNFRKTEKRSKSFLKYQALLTGKKPLTKIEINSFCWALNGVKAVNLNSIDRSELLELFESIPERKITKEQSDFGIEWLTNQVFKKNGEPRKNCKLDSEQQAIVKNFKCFIWSNIFNSQSHYGNYGYNSPYKSYVPVYRVYDKKGNYFEYTVLGGGPGGSIEIVLNP